MLDGLFRHLALYPSNFVVLGPFYFSQMRHPCGKFFGEEQGWLDL